MSWEDKELGELTLYVKRGVSPKYVLENGIPIVNQRCIRENTINFDTARLSSKDKKITEVKFLQVGDTLINSTGVGTLGRTAYVKKLDQPSSADTHVTIVRPNKTIIDPKYLSLYLNAKEDIIENMGKGATGQTELSAKDLSSLNVFYPKSLQTQKRIADILSAYDDLIENNLKRIKLLEQAAQNIYKEWFVNLRFPGNENTPINEETGLPVGWEYGVVSDLCEVKSGYAFKSKQWKKKGNPVIKIKNINNNTVSLNDTGFVDDEVAQNAKKYELFSGDVIIAMTGATVGKVGLIPKIDKRIYLNQRVGLFRPLSEENNNIALVFSFFLTDDSQQQVLNFAQGAAQPNISGSEIGNIKLNIADSKVLSEFNKLTKPSIDLIQTLYGQNQKLKAARDILLPRLMNRTIEV
ncbi:MAG: restriction endonuclease subunit S [Nonlabens sp.]|uniref:restriction endonuclease subunit S n=1 Tax=Nonlabens sp. TaxID=1888209 RepID=UPI0032195A70